MVDCRACKKRFRADQLDDARPCTARQGTSRARLHRAAQLQPDAARPRSAPRRTPRSVAYLRAETCQPIFNDFKRVREAARQKIPFGIAQIGKAFRNEINPRNFTFRSREFEQAELEFFVPPERAREVVRALAGRARSRSTASSASATSACASRPHAPDELAHYAQRRGRHRVPVPVRLAGDRGHPRPRRLGPLAPQRVSRARTSAITDRGDQGALHADGDRDVGRASTAPASRCSATPTPRRSSRRRRDAHGAALPRRRSRRSRSRCCRSRRSSPSRRTRSSASCAAASTSSTTTPATSAGATAARTRSARRSASRSTSRPAATAR